MSRIALQALGAEKGKYLSHALDKVWLQNGIQGEGEEWICHEKNHTDVAFECLGKESGKFLSHANTFILSLYIIESGCFYN
jgi:hypothetical protein